MMTRRLLAIGECMVELSSDRKTLFSLGFAGDTFNTAWYARQLASRGSLGVSYLSAVGDDALSDQMLTFMQDAGIDTHMARIPDAEPGLYMIFLNEGERSFQYWRSRSAARYLADDLDRLPNLEAGDIVYFSGITMAILPEIRRNELLRHLVGLSDQGVRTVFDPNLRPKLWPCIDSMKHWTMTSAKVAHIVLPSHEDEATHFGDRCSEATAERYLESGAELVVVKDGPEPVLVLGADGDTFRYRPEILETVVDTTAAGDAFNAAFLVDYLERNRLREAVRAGCALARHVVSHRGALVPISKVGLIREKNRLRA